MKLNYTKLKKDYPKATKALKVKSNAPSRLIKFFDSRGVRVYLGYGASGGHVPTVYRKRTVAEFNR